MVAPIIYYRGDKQVVMLPVSDDGRFGWDCDFIQAYQSVVSRFHNDLCGYHSVCHIIEQHGSNFHEG